MIHLIAGFVGTKPEPALPILLFFAYAFLGYIMECIVLTIEKKSLVINRGFVRHMPICIIYGFGAMIGYGLLRPIAHNYVLLFIVGAIGATGFEYIVARMQIFLFGDFWWDYTEKPLNYKGILCLESTIGWGILAVLIVKVIHGGLVNVVGRVPQLFALPLAVLLLAAYLLDFVVSARYALSEKRARENEQDNIAAEDVTV